MSDFPPCATEIYEHGETVCVFHARAAIVEPWVQKVALESGQRVDWHYVGGYAVVRFLGERQLVLEAVAKLKPDLEAACHAQGCRPEHFRIVE